jgi:hypothetical protein
LSASHSVSAGRDFLRQICELARLRARTPAAPMATQRGHAESKWLAFLLHRILANALGGAF